MKLVDMLETPEEMKAEGEAIGPMPTEAPKPHYPWGLQIELNDKGLKKLGMPMPKIGEEVYGCFVARVTRLNESADENSQYRCVVLQIVQLAVGDEKDAEKGVEAAPVPAPVKKNKILRRY